MVKKEQKIEILDDISHAILRPGMYIGSTRLETQNFWILNGEDKFEKKDIKYIPGLLKIFVEILDNALDEHINGHGNQIDVTINHDTSEYSVRDYGRGIPLEKHKEAKLPTPQVVFTHLRAGSNFQDEVRETVGMNGVGASLTTIFSEKLFIEIIRRGKIYQQTFLNNLSKIEKPKITKKKSTDRNGTFVCFKPDMKIFSELIPVGLIKKKCLDLTVAYPNLKIVFTEIKDGKEKQNEIKCKSFSDFMERFDTEYKIFEDKKLRLKLAICHNTFSDTFDQYSNINGADTFRGGTHIDYIKDIFVPHFKEKIKKEFKVEPSTYDVTKHMLIVMFQTWNNPQFEGQTKEKFVNCKKEVTDYFNDVFTTRKLTSISNDLKELKQSINDLVNIKSDKKEMSELRKAQKKHLKKKVPKLIEASSKDRSKCSLYITEGDSAIANLASVRNSKIMAGLPLRGKVLNVFDVTPKKIVENKEIQSLMAVLGLTIGEKATPKSLNYGKIIIATDQDMDGYCIRCLLVNLFYKFWPELFDNGHVYVLETPLYEVIGKKGKTHYFYNKEEFNDFMKNKKSSAYEISYFKGLGSCGKEAWDYMINENPNIVRISNSKDSKLKLKLAFGSDTDARKKWLT